MWHVAGHRTPCLHALPACKPPMVTQTPRAQKQRHTAGPTPGAPASQRTSSDWSTSWPSPAAAGSAPHSRQEQRPCPPTKLSKPAARQGQRSAGVGPCRAAGSREGQAAPRSISGTCAGQGSSCAALSPQQALPNRQSKSGGAGSPHPGSAPTFDGNEGRQAAAGAPHKRRLKRAGALQRGHG